MCGTIRKHPRKAGFLYFVWFDYKNVYVSQKTNIKTPEFNAVLCNICVPKWLFKSSNLILFYYNNCVSKTLFSLQKRTQFKTSITFHSKSFSTQEKQLYVKFLREEIWLIFAQKGAILCHAYRIDLKNR